MEELGAAWIASYLVCLFVQLVYTSFVWSVGSVGRAVEMTGLE